MSDLSQLLEGLIQTGMRRAAELGIGFATTRPFDPEEFRRLNGGVYSVTSVDTQTEYGFMVKPEDPTAIQEDRILVVHVASYGQIIEEKNFRMVTLYRGPQGQVMGRSGWQ